MDETTIVERLVKLESQFESQNELYRTEILRNTEGIKRLDKKFEDLSDLTYSVKLMANSVGDLVKVVDEVKDNQEKQSVKIDNMKDNYDNLENKFQIIENKPAKKLYENWEKIKLSVAVSIATFIALGIVGSLMYFNSK